MQINKELTKEVAINYLKEICENMDMINCYKVMNTEESVDSNNKKATLMQAIDIVNDYEYNDMKKIAVFGATIDMANAKLEDLVNNMKYEVVVEFYKDYKGFTATLKNGTVFKSIYATESTRSEKYDYAYISHGIKSNVLESVIFPMIPAGEFTFY